MRRISISQGRAAICVGLGSRMGPFVSLSHNDVFYMIVICVASYFDRVQFADDLETSCAYIVHLFCIFLVCMVQGVC